MDSVVRNGLTPAEEQLTERIAASRSFQRAASLRELLLYIAAHGTHREELSEQSIGMHVFGRADSYNPAEDNIVRASVRQLRVKLKEYFENEGRDEPVLLEIPKGAYVPVFVTRAAGITTPVVGDSRSPQWQWFALGGVLLAAVALWFAVDNARLRAAALEQDSVFGQFFRQTNGPVRFVLTDSALAVMTGMRGVQIGVEQYADRSFVGTGDAALAAKPDLGGMWRDLATRQITSLADVGVLTRALQAHPSAARRIEVKHARHMQTRDFKSGNFIIMGSALSDPWVSLFDGHLDFQFSRAIRTDANAPVAVNKIVNREPKAGEAAEYTNEASGRHWARIALVKSFSGPGSVLLAAGLGFEGTEGAGEFLLQPESLVEIRRLLQVPAGERLPSFELLLEITASQGTARSSRIAGWRRY